MGGKFPASSLKQQQVNAYRMLEKEKMNKSLNDYITISSQLKVIHSMASFMFIALLALLSFYRSKGEESPFLLDLLIYINDL